MQLFLAMLVAAVSAFSGIQSGQQPVQPPRVRMEMVVESRFGFQETIEKIKEAAIAEKYGVQGVHELSKILTEKGFPREPLTIVEVCNPKAASESLDNDILVGLMMPCPIQVYQVDDKVFVATFDTRAMSRMYDGLTMKQTGEAVYTALKKILKAVEK